MTITIKIRNDDAPGGRKAKVIRHDIIASDDVGFDSNDSVVAELSDGEETTVYVHTGMSVTVEEVEE